MNGGEQRAWTFSIAPLGQEQSPAQAWLKESPSSEWVVWYVDMPLCTCDSESVVPW